MEKSIDTTPAGYKEGGEPTAISTGDVESGTNTKGMKASKGERTILWVLLAVVIVAAIVGVSLTLVLKPVKQEKLNFDDPYIGSNQEPIIGSNQEPIIEEPFEIEASLFSSDVNEPYASIEGLREEIEALIKNSANTIILQQANGYGYGYFEDVMFVAGDMSQDMSRPEMSKSQPVSATASASAPSRESSELFQGVDDFETYQHEAGTVKNDLVKSNGAHVFAAVNSDITVWDLEGSSFETYTIRSGASKDQNDASRYQTGVSIQALLMNPEGNKLIAIASDYSKHTWDSIVSDSLLTQVTVFGIEGTSLTEISQTYIDGYHIDSYSVGNNIHVVTRTTLRASYAISDQTYRYMFDEELSSEEYIVAATLKAEEIIPDLVDKLIDFFTEDGEIVLSRLVGSPNSFNDYKSITQVSSFDTSNVGDEGGMEFYVSKSLVLQPGYSEYVYATDEWIWISDENSVWSLEKQDYVQQTMLLGFKLDGASSRFEVVGTVPGRLLNQFSIDFVKDNGKEYIRTAITQNFFQNAWFRPMPEPMPMPIMVDEVESSAFDGDEDMNFEAQDEPESRTSNEIIIFEIPEVEEDDGGRTIKKLRRLGSVKVGKKDETITAVRFFDNVSYVVTFERTDPFYVLDLSDPMDPKILGELEIPGFSEFMHPMNDDNSMLLTVGQDADDNGRVTGFQISIFNSTIPNDPKLVDRLVIASGEGSSASSSSSWDERAFRYIQVDGIGRLIIPLNVYSWSSSSGQETFDGFAVFGVDLNRSEKLITREINIDHEDKDDLYGYTNKLGCYCSPMWLPERSFVFDGNLMTMKRSSVVSTDLVSEEENWSHSFYRDCNC
jgi:hypothetical protein